MLESMKMLTFLYYLSIVSYVLGETVHPIGPKIIDGRIVGGEPAEIENFPYQVSVQRYGNHYCGGSIITDKHVLTAAHCSLLNLSGYTIMVGSNNINSGGDIYEIESIAVHAKYYVPEEYDNDIAVMKIVGAFAFSEKVAVIRLVQQDFTPNGGENAIVTGWGRLEQMGVSPDILQFVEVPLLTNDDCSIKYGVYGDKITDTMVCAGYTEGGKDACQGDSGGPLVYENEEGEKVLIGVVSWGRGCALPLLPGVYASVSHLKYWITSNSGAS